MTREEFDEWPLLLTTGQVCKATGYSKNTWPAIARSWGIYPHPASNVERRWLKDDIEEFLALKGSTSSNEERHRRKSIPHHP